MNQLVDSDILLHMLADQAQTSLHKCPVSLELLLLKSIDVDESSDRVQIYFEPIAQLDSRVYILGGSSKWTAGYSYLNC